MSVCTDPVAPHIIQTKILFIFSFASKLLRGAAWRSHLYYVCAKKKLFFAVFFCLPMHAQIFAAWKNLVGHWPYHHKKKLCVLQRPSFHCRRSPSSSSRSRAAMISRTELNTLSSSARVFVCCNFFRRRVYTLSETQKKSRVYRAIPKKNSLCWLRSQCAHNK